jgi:hypothetical protein
MLILIVVSTIHPPPPPPPPIHPSKLHVEISLPSTYIIHASCITPSLVDDPHHNLENWTENGKTHARRMCAVHVTRHASWVKFNHNHFLRPSSYLKDLLTLTLNTLSLVMSDVRRKMAAHAAESHQPRRCRRRPTRGLSQSQSPNLCNAQCPQITLAMIHATSAAVNIHRIAVAV